MNSQNTPRGSASCSPEPLPKKCRAVVQPSPITMLDNEVIHRPTGRSRRVPRIEHDTPIVARAVAEGVHEEASGWLGEPLPRSWIRQLVARADTVYAYNAHFRRLLRGQGNRGLDWLWAFNRHWLADLLWRHRYHLYTRLPSSFSAGHPLPKRSDPSSPFLNPPKIPKRLKQPVRTS